MAVLGCISLVLVIIQPSTKYKTKIVVKLSSRKGRIYEVINIV